jgi:hypothetical protein
MVLSGTEVIYVSKVNQFHGNVHLTEITKSLILTNQFTEPGSDPPRAFHGYGFKMQVWPLDVEIRKNMVSPSA